MVNGRLELRLLTMYARGRLKEEILTALSEFLAPK